MVEGFRQSVDSGLYVPPDLSRVREVWTAADWRLLRRVARFFKANDVGMILRCMHDTCDDKPLQKLLEPGRILLRCNCTDRVLSKDF